MLSLNYYHKKICVTATEPAVWWQRRCAHHPYPDSLARKQQENPILTFFFLCHCSNSPRSWQTPCALQGCRPEFCWRDSDCAPALFWTLRLPWRCVFPQSTPEQGPGGWERTARLAEQLQEKCCYWLLTATRDWPSLRENDVINRSRK